MHATRRQNAHPSQDRDRVAAAAGVRTSRGPCSESPGRTTAKGDAGRHGVVGALAWGRAFARDLRALVGGTAEVGRCARCGILAPSRGGDGGAFCRACASADAAMRPGDSGRP